MRAAGLSYLIGAALVSGCTAGAATGLPESLPAGDYTPVKLSDVDLADLQPEAAESARDDVLGRAKVWREPPVPIARAALDRTPGAPWHDAEEIACRFLPTEPHGTTGKFDCVLPGGQVVKVKYARSGEIQSEIAASRLMHALGFGADDMHLVRRVRCFGCPWSPFLTMRVLDWLALRDPFARRIDYTEYTDFEWVAVERRFPAPEVKVDDRTKGWSWFELSRVSSAKGGASRAEIDGLRLVAMLLNHWDNKAENQRLVCLGGWNDTVGCVEPFAYIHDLGSDFGPHKPNLGKWNRTPVWSDAARCELSMARLPYRGSTFGTVTISEAGRRFIAARLSAISDWQLHALFSAARFAEYDDAADPESDIAKWVGAFKDKVRQIADRAPCPSS